MTCVTFTEHLLKIIFMHLNEHVNLTCTKKDPRTERVTKIEKRIRNRLRRNSNLSRAFFTDHMTEIRAAVQSPVFNWLNDITWH